MTSRFPMHTIKGINWYMHWFTIELTKGPGNVVGSLLQTRPKKKKEEVILILRSNEKSLIALLCFLQVPQLFPDSLLISFTDLALAYVTWT